MTNNVIDLRNFVNASARSTPTSFSEININNLLLLTTEIPNNLDTSRSYLNASQVATDYGTNSETFAYASSVFAQTPNILLGNGKLIIAPMVNAVSATRGKFVSASLTANLAALQAVDDGDLRVTLNGTVIDLADIDFTNCTSIADCATILQRLLPNITITVDSGIITFTSKKVGSTSAVVLGSSSGSGTDLTAAGLLNVAGGTATSGANSSGETIVDAITRLSAEVQFTPFISNKLVEDAVAITTSLAVEATDKIWVNVWSDSNDLDNVIEDIKSVNNRTFALFHTVVEESYKFLPSYISGLCSVDFFGNNTFLNANTQLRTLASVPADTGMNQALFDKAKTVGAIIYSNNGGLAGVVNNRYGDTGQFPDQVYGRQALTYALTVGDFNSLRSGAVQQTPQGMDQLLSATNLVFARFVRVGYIGVGLNWNSPIFFGNQQDLKDSVSSVGYYIYNNPIALQAQNERENRDAPLQQAAYKEAGFIYRASVDVLVEA